MYHRRKARGLGWRRQLPDRRDRSVSSLGAVRQKLNVAPPTFDLVDAAMPPCYDQLATSSCTGNGIAGAVQYRMQKLGLPALGPTNIPSRLFIYYGERDIEGSADQDCGAEIRDGIKAIASTGVCDESEWPFDVTKVTTKPAAQCYADAAAHVVSAYYAVPQDLRWLKAAISSGYPVVFGFSVPQSFMSDMTATTGVMQAPALGEPIVGGHCVMGAAYNDGASFAGWQTVGGVRCRNSWGAKWGLEGYFWMPYSVILDPNQASDLWAIEVVAPTGG